MNLKIRKKSKTDQKTKLRRFLVNIKNLLPSNVIIFKPNGDHIVLLGRGVTTAAYDVAVRVTGNGSLHDGTPVQIASGMDIIITDEAGEDEYILLDQVTAYLNHISPNRKNRVVFPMEPIYNGHVLLGYSQLGMFSGGANGDE
jgi:hypothetical protein